MPILVEDPTDGLDDSTITAEDKTGFVSTL